MPGGTRLPSGLEHRCALGAFGRRVDRTCLRFPDVASRLHPRFNRGLSLLSFGAQEGDGSNTRQQTLKFQIPCIPFIPRCIRLIADCAWGTNCLALLAKSSVT